MAGTYLSDFETLIEEGSDAVFNRAAKMPRQKYWEPLVMKKPLKKKVGNYDTVGDIGPAEVHIEGNEISFDKIQEKDRTQIETIGYVKGVEATKEMLKFELENVVAQTFGTPLVRVMHNKKEKVVAAVYNGVFTTTGADGVYQASNSHPLQNAPGTLNDNLMTGSINVDNLKTAYNMFNSIYDQAGEYFDTEASHLLIHPDKIFLVTEIFSSALMAFELTNTKNSLPSLMPLKILVNKYLTSTYWFMLDKGLEAGCVLQTNGGLELETWWEKNNKVYRGTAMEYYGAGMIAPGYGFVASAG